MQAETYCSGTDVINNAGSSTRDSQNSHYENLPMQYTEIYKVVKNDNFQ